MKNYQDVQYEMPTKDHSKLNYSTLPVIDEDHIPKPPEKIVNHSSANHTPATANHTPINHLQKIKEF